MGIVSTDSIITIGSNATCDLVLSDDKVAGVHAQARLDNANFLWVRDENSIGGTYLQRNDHWVRVRLVCLCVGDKVKFANTEVDIEQITQLFGADLETRLAPTPVATVLNKRTGRYALKDPDDEPSFATPTRNPTTGNIEDEP